MFWKLVLDPTASFGETGKLQKPWNGAHESRPAPQVGPDVLLCAFERAALVAVGAQEED